MSNLDNLKGKSSSDLKKELLEAQKIVEQPKAKEVESTPAPAAPTAETKILGKFNSQDDLIKAYEEAQKKITELSQAKKTEEIPEPKATKDPLWDYLFGNQQAAPTPQPVDEVPQEDDRVTKLAEELKQLKQAGTYSIMQQQQMMERMNSAEKLKADPDLPWSNEVESELETKIFTKYPQLKYSKGGYEVAHTLLKGLKVNDFKEVAARQALEKEKSKSVKTVETPSKSEPEAPVNPATLSQEELRKLLQKQFGSYNRD